MVGLKDPQPEQGTINSPLRCIITSQRVSEITVAQILSANPPQSELKCLVLTDSDSSSMGQLKAVQSGSPIEFSGPHLFFLLASYTHNAPHSISHLRFVIREKYVI